MTTGTHIVVIGTAGRTNRERLSPVMYRGAYQHFGRFCAQFPQPWRFHSGGAAWMDHLAVLAFLTTADQGSTLDLYLPADWVWTVPQFEDTGERDWRTNPGGTANYYHKLFSGLMRANTLQDIETARRRGAVLHVIPGFRERNAVVATKGDVVAAYTWGQERPEDGGTQHTWGLIGPQVRKEHFCLTQFVPQ